MIIKIDRYQPEIRVSVVAPGKHGGKLVDYKRIRLVIVSCPDKFISLVSPIYRHGTWLYVAPGIGDVVLDAGPAIVYPAFEVDNEGDLVFRFDRNLWDRRPGRYAGRIENLDGQCLGMLDIELQPNDHIITRVSTGSPSYQE
jgi:hypothetical protein